MKCMKCAHVNPAEYNFCEECGFNLSLKLCPECGHGNPNAFRFCEECGYAFEQPVEESAAPPPLPLAEPEQAPEPEPPVAPARIEAKPTSEPPPPVVEQSQTIQQAAQPESAPPPQQPSRQQSEYQQQAYQQPVYQSPPVYYQPVPAAYQPPKPKPKWGFRIVKFVFGSILGFFISQVGELLFRIAVDYFGITFG